MKNSRNLILGEAVYISIIYRIPDCWIYSFNGYGFSCDRMTGENRELTENWLGRIILRNWRTTLSTNWTNFRGALFLRENHFLTYTLRRLSPPVTYGIAVWGNCNNLDYIKSLQALHRRAGRLIFLFSTRHTISTSYGTHTMELDLWRV